ncbi:serine/threonine-protein kinase [Mastigocoleus sp. MO_188.B34]|uniref:serine/threonine-protein kinase n=1 Tax=Mastigocoleus sp. MO_188.B34 TaxID=3036635 RepID=UPI002633AACF|nr:serine/threonine-protein kinase [Mastigocoleus sp. MO_188.B34]MDJ0696590.1 serine/threonine-protein kinase [Mastigocoleus sp. MO_188.B34]
MHVYCSKQHPNQKNHRFCTTCGEPLPLNSGEILVNRYRIISQLGQGGFGRTYLAEDLIHSHQKCVVKEFAPQVEKAEELEKAKELFDREADVLRQLKHPQIPGFHSSLQPKLGTKDFFFLVQDYVDGDTYFDLSVKKQAQGEKFTEAEVIELLKNILPVLSYIHAKDVIHRDISPDNLMLRRSDNLPVLIDFGAVKQLPASKGFWFTQLAANRTILGKKGYAPEEQLRQGKVFPSSDLYSLAVTALVLVTGKEPQKLYDSYQGNWRWGEIKISPQFASILKKMLSYKPSDRYPLAEQVLKDLEVAANTKVTNPQISKIRTMVAAPHRKKVSAIATQFNNKTQAVVHALPLPIWLRPFAISLITTTAILLVFAGVWAVVNGVINAVTSISLPSISLPSLELPKLPGAGNSSDEGSNNQNTSLVNRVLSRREQLEIPDGFFYATVNQIFYTENPEAEGRSLTSSAEDAKLREKWFESAQELLQKLEQANLSVATRRKLGNYSGKDYENWRRQIETGRLGNYTTNRLDRDTNNKFYRLFPNQSRERLDQKTFGQIWYAIAADKVSQLESGN